jgi:hypothetical protein
MKLNSYLFYHLNQLKHTNIIICEPRKNSKYISEQIGKIFESISSLLTHVNYIDLRYSYLLYSGIPRNNLRHLAQNILQEVIRFEYKHKIKSHQQKQIRQLLSYSKNGYQISTTLDPVDQKTDAEEPRAVNNLNEPLTTLENRYENNVVSPILKQGQQNMKISNRKGNISEKNPFR